MVANVVTSVKPNSISTVLDEWMPQVYAIDDGIQQGHKSLRSTFREIAEALEKVMLQYGQPEQVKEICGLICGRLDKDRRGHLSSNVVHALDEKYIKKLDKSSITSLTHVNDVPVHCSITTNEIVDAFKNASNIDPTQLGRDGIIESAYQAYDFIHRIEECAQENGIELVDPHSNQNQIDKTNSDSDKQYSEKISRPPALIPVDQAIRDLDEESEKLGMKYLEKLEKWIHEQRTDNCSQTIEQAIELRDMWNAEIRMIDQINDRKSRRTMVDWAHILAAKSDRGGTGASSYSRRTVTDPSTGKPMVDPKTLQPILREITKEQIDARGPKYASEIEQILAATPMRLTQQKRYVEITSGRGEYRAHAAEDKLSRQA